MNSYPKTDKAFIIYYPKKIETKEFYIGEKIAPKITKRNKIKPDGELKDVSTQVHDRKIPLEKIRNQMNKDQCDFFRV